MFLILQIWKEMYFLGVPINNLRLRNIDKTSQNFTDFAYILVPYF